VRDIGLALRGNILDQRSPEGDVQYLYPPADRENGSPSFLRFLDQRRFRRIARGVNGTYFFVAFLTVASRIDVFAASQHEARDGIENRRRGVSVREWGDDQWYEPCTFQGSHVSGGQPDTTGIAIGANASGNSNCAGSDRLARGRHE
jgi:hypothetical protein